MEEYGCWLLCGSLATFAVLGYTGAPFWLWVIVGAIPVWGGDAPQIVQALYVVVAVIGVVTPLRRILLSSLVMKTMKNLGLMPTISPTERQALEAGVVWLDAEFFSGKPNLKKMLQEPYPQLTAEEKAFMEGPVNRLCESIDDWAVWQTRDLDAKTWEIIKKEKFMGMIIPKEYGGLGFSALAHSEVIHKISSRSLPGCITVMVPNSLGPAELLVHYGTEEQKRNLLPRLASGEEVPCFALTEPGAGSDAGSIQARGEIFRGDDGQLYVRLSWNKRWITLAAISTTLGLAFRLYDPKNLLGKGEDIGITCALIPTSTPGVIIGQRHDPLGVPFYNCPTHGNDVVVPIDCIIGGPEKAGQGWLMLMDCLGAGRGISLPAQAAGGAKMITRVVGAHAILRKQFGLSIGRFEGVEEPLARVASATYFLEAMRKVTCGALDQGIKPAVITAIAKYIGTDVSRWVINDAMDVAGGSGISRGPKNKLAHLYIACPIGITVEGANILTRTLMIFGQGALRAHPFAFKEVKALEKNDLVAFDAAFWGHIGHIVRNKFRAIFLSLTRGKIACSPVSGPTARYYKQLAWVSASFAILTDIAMGVFGGKLKTKGSMTGRFADILSWQYVAFSVLRRWQAEGQREKDLPIVHYTMKLAFNQIQQAFDGILSNFDAPIIGWIFRGPIRWWSRVNSISSLPPDHLKTEVAQLMQRDADVRNSLTDGGYWPTDTKTEQIAKLDEALAAVLLAEDLEKRIKKAIRQKKLPKKRVRELIDEATAQGLITAQEKSVLARSEELRWDCIQVDDFSQQQYLSRSV